MKFKQIVIGFITTTLLLAGALAAHVGAQAANANAAQGVQISPTLVELNASKGKTYSINLGVTNVTGTDLVYKTSVSDFGAAGETGSPHIFIDTKLTPASSVITWVDTAPQFSLDAHQSRTVTAQINVPANAEPGGHYGVIRFSGTAPKLDRTGVGLSASAGVLLLVRVDGLITEKADLASFYTSGSQSGKETSFFENGPAYFVVRIQNVGNIHVKPVGNIEVKDMFGGVVTNIPINKDKSNVLPKTIRRFDDAKVNKDWMIGRYTANLTLGYGSKGQAITGTISFWVIPYKIILIVLVILATVIYILRRIIKVYNKRIIEKAKNENKNSKKTKGKK
ncbi:MAG: hypothetical protein NTV39_00835 [Candidatus Saccharibacteria bacterium]|nr:hypothetical protein [Candidatus Saccharibacteria bacterium]